MMRFVFSLAIVVSIFVGSAAAGERCPMRSVPEHRPLTKQDWLKALSEVQPGTTLKAFGKIVRRTLKSEFLESGSVSGGG